MNNQFYLLFSLHGLLYGVETLRVREIALLPEFMPMVSAPTDIVGMIDLRARIVPIMDLDLHFGHQPSAYQLSDRVIFLEHQDKLMGIIVNQVHDVKLIDFACIDTDLAHQAISNQQVSPTAGIARIDGDLVTLLNIESLFQSVVLPALVQEGIPCTGSQATFFSHTSLEEQAILRDRAHSLRQRTETQVLAGLLSFAVLKIGDEFFGVETAMMREFADISNVTPIPCCPDYIIGNMNLRGEIVTLLSLHHKLNVSPSGKRKAVVIKVDDIIAGITVDDVLDITYVHPSSIKSVPTAAYAKSQDYAKGTAAFGNQTMTILDLSRLFAQGELVVNEHV